jgi:hypothetical protein
MSKTFKRPNPNRFFVRRSPFIRFEGTRQTRRAAKRKEAFKMISHHYGGEPRRRRRAMAFALAKRKSK